MKIYSMDLRRRVLAACDAGRGTAEVARTCQVSPAWARWLKQRRREHGGVEPRRWGRRAPGLFTPERLQQHRLRRALQDRCADDFNCAGGIFEFLTAAHAVEVMGHCCWHGSSIEMGVGQVAHLHAAAAARACVLPSDFVSGLIREHTLITWDWPYADGHLPLPEGPGLGVELDRAALQRYGRAEATFTAE